ncbi:hypothetical protein [Neorhizobium petrolearium]|uniref:hypothetical protein n=1 Tax=Neorhizobium petrolearium TaxID=515361 RepID=UPI003F16D9E7
MGKSTCERLSAGGWQQGYILSIETGETVGEIPDVTAFQSTVLQKQETEIPLNGALFKDRDFAAYPDANSQSVVLRRLSDGSEFDRLRWEAANSARGKASVLAVKASPSGRFVAVISNISGGSGAGSIVDIWDIDERRHLNTFTTDAGHIIGPNAEWTADERHLIALQDDPRASADQRDGLDL